MNHFHRIQPTLDRQYGLVTRRQLRSSGLTKRQIDRSLTHGLLQRVHGGVYRTAGSKDSHEQRLMAACLVNGRGSVVTHRGACWLWGIELGLDPVVELSAPRSSSPRTPGVVVHRPRRIDARHTVERGAFALTTPARTVADLGAVVELPVVERAMEQVLRKRWTSASYLRHLCTELDNPQRKGPPVLRQALDNRLLGDTPSDSDLEVAMAELCQRFDVPMPVFQHELVIDGVKKRIDFAFPHLRLAIEVDGWESHIEFRVFQGDRVRRNELEIRHWHILNFTWHQIVHRPRYVAETILRALATYALPVGA